MMQQRVLLRREMIMMQRDCTCSNMPKGISGMKSIRGRSNIGRGGGNPQYCRFITLPLLCLRWMGEGGGCTMKILVCVLKVCACLNGVTSLSIARCPSFSIKQSKAQCDMFKCGKTLLRQSTNFTKPHQQ